MLGHRGRGAGLAAGGGLVLQPRTSRRQAQADVGPTDGQAVSHVVLLRRCEVVSTVDTDEGPYRAFIAAHSLAGGGLWTGPNFPVS